MSDIQIVNRSAPFARVQTGAMKFHGDWAGLFVRGDDCIVLRYILRDARNNETEDGVRFIDTIIRAIDAAHSRDGAKEEQSK